MFHNRRGFTLIELLVVISIIGILAGLIIANTMSARRVARDRRRVGDVQLIHGAIQVFRKDNNNALPTGGPCGYGGLVPTYISSEPRDPQGACYIYNRTPGGSCPAGAYIVAARLETTGVGDAQKDQTCWNGDSPDNQVYVVTGR